MVDHPPLVAMATTIGQIAGNVRAILTAIRGNADLINAGFAQMTKRFDTLDQEVNPPPADGGPLKLTIAVPILLNKQGVQAMPGTVTFTDDHDEQVMLNWSDDVGAVHPTDPTTVSSSDDTIATGDVSADNNFLFVRSVKDGECDLTLTNGSATDMLHVIIGPPVPTGLSIDAETAVSVPKGTTA